MYYYILYVSLTMTFIIRFRAHPDNPLKIHKLFISTKTGFPDKVIFTNSRG